MLVLGDFLGNNIYEDKVGIFHFLYAIGLWTFLMLGIEFMTLKNKSTRSLLLGNPNIIIRDGVMDRKLHLLQIQPQQILSQRLSKMIMSLP